MPGRTARPTRRASEGDGFVFRHAATALWEQDVSELEERARAWRQQGVTDVRTHLLQNPEVLRDALASISTVSMNESALILYDAGRPQDLAGPWDPRLGETAPDAAADIVCAMISGGTGGAVSCPARSATGRSFDVLLRLYVPRPRDGYPWVLVNVIPSGDLQAQDGVARAVIDTIPDQVYAKDSEGRYILANQTLAEWTGEASPNDLLGKTDLDCFPPEIARKFQADDRQVIESGQAMLNIEEETRSPRGEVRWSLTTKVPFRDRQGRVIGLLGVSREITERRTLERSLDDERRRLRTLIDNVPDPIFMKDSQGRILMANENLARLMGVPKADDLIGRTDRDFYPRERAERYELEERRVLERGEPLVNDSEAWDVPRGTRRWLRVAKIPLHDQDGNVIGLVGISRDFTDQHKAEEQLLSEQMYLRALMDHSFDSIYFKDRQSRFLKTSTKLANLFRVNPAEVIGKTDFDFFTEEHARPAYEDEQRIIETGEPIIDVEERETWPDRPDTWVTTTKLPLRDANGAVIGTFGISRDITARHQIEERNLLLAAMVEHSKDAIIGIDLEDRVTSWNKGAEQVFGYLASEMEGKPIVPLIAPGAESPSHLFTESLVQKGRVHQFDSTVTRKDGRQILVTSTLSLIEDSRGRIVGTTLISRDVTEQKALQVQVIRAQRLESLSTLAGGIAHQFNNINAAVRGYLEIAQSEESLPDNVRGWIRDAIKGIQRAVEITERLQSFGTAAHARQEAIDLAETVRAILPLFADQVKEEAVEIHRELTPVTVRASRSTLNFVITSIVTNSFHALMGSRRREITLRSRAESDYGMLEISDTGCGISGENLTRVFTPFFTTKGEWAEPGSPQSRVKGVGLSLSVCQSTVAEQGGWIEVESPPGEGATLRVWLPAAVRGAEAGEETG